MINVSFGLPDPEAAGLLIPATKALFHAKVVPATALLGLYEKRVFVQIAAGVSVLVSVGIGFTITTTS